MKSEISVYIANWYDATAYAYVEAVKQKRWQVTRQLEKLMLGIDRVMAQEGEK